MRNMVRRVIWKYGYRGATTQGIWKSSIRLFPTNPGLTRYSTVFSMRKLPAERDWLSFKNQATPTPTYTCFNPSTGQITWSSITSSGASSSLSYGGKSEEGDVGHCKTLISSSIATLEQADWQLLSGLLLPQLSSLYRSSAIFNSRYKFWGLKLQLLEIVFSYFNCLSHGKSLNL